MNNMIQCSVQVPTFMPNSEPTNNPAIRISEIEAVYKKDNCRYQNNVRIEPNCSIITILTKRGNKYEWYYNRLDKLYLKDYDKLINL